MKIVKNMWIFCFFLKCFNWNLWLMWTLWSFISVSWSRHSSLTSIHMLLLVHPSYFLLIIATIWWARKIYIEIQCRFFLLTFLPVLSLPLPPPSLFHLCAFPLHFRPMPCFLLMKGYIWGYIRMAFVCMCPSNNSLLLAGFCLSP